MERYEEIRTPSLLPSLASIGQVPELPFFRLFSKVRRLRDSISGFFSLGYRISRLSGSSEERNIHVLCVLDNHRQNGIRIVNSFPGRGEHENLGAVIAIVHPIINEPFRGH